MKRLVSVLLCLFTVLSLLAGCSDGYPEGQTLDFGDLQVTLPGDFINLSEESYASDADFLYGWNTLIVKGMAEAKTTLQEMTLEDYTSLIISGNGLTCTPEVYADAYLFAYETPVGGENYTYTTAVFQGHTHFWLIQFYCPSNKITENQPEIDMILAGIQTNSQ